MSSNATQSEKIIGKIQEKFNKILLDESFFVKWDYYFEPRTSSKEKASNSSQIITFINPFSKKTLKILWNKIKRTTTIIDPTLDDKSLEEFHNALEYIEWKAQEKEETTKKKQFVDFFEDEQKLIIVVEIPASLDNITDDVEILGSPHELTIRTGPFEKSVHLNPRVDPQSAEAFYNNGLIEIRLNKVPKPPKTKIKVQEIKDKTKKSKDKAETTNTVRIAKEKKDTTRIIPNIKKESAKSTKQQKNKKQQNKSSKTKSELT